MYFNETTTNGTGSVRRFYETVIPGITRGPWVEDAERVDIAVRKQKCAVQTALTYIGRDIAGHGVVYANAWLPIPRGRVKKKPTYPTGRRTVIVFENDFGTNVIYRRPIDIITFVVRSSYRYCAARSIDAKRFSEIFASAIHFGGKLFSPILFFKVSKIHLRNRSAVNAANSVFNSERQWLHTVCFN